jgi:hypothetical protein
LVEEVDHVGNEVIFKIFVDEIQEMDVEVLQIGERKVDEYHFDTGLGRLVEFLHVLDAENIMTPLGNLEVKETSRLFFEGQYFHGLGVDEE